MEPKAMRRPPLCRFGNNELHERPAFRAYEITEITPLPLPALPLININLHRHTPSPALS